MTRTRLFAAAALAVLSISSCAAFKEAMTSHVDVVARAGSQELTVGRLSEMLGTSEIPLRPDAARTLAQLWVNYHLLGHAGAQGDSMNTVEDADAGMWSAVAQRKTQKFYEVISKDWGVVDTSRMEQAYNDGELLGASHILLSKQPVGISATANDSIKREAERIAETVTAATFAQVARTRSQDPGSKAVTTASSRRDRWWRRSTPASAPCRRAASRRWSRRSSATTSSAVTPGRK
jgi:hypothetical protein